MAYVAAENRLSITDIYGCCGQDAMGTKETNTCAMGVDVGSLLYAAVGFKSREQVYEICYLARVSSFNDIHDIGKRFNVQCAVIDMEPELRKAREFQAAEPYPVFLCDYVDVKSGPQWDEEKNIVKVNRTEILDTSHELFVKPGTLILPRRCDEVDKFAGQARNTAKILEEDSETGSREYRYRKLGEDHYRHALNYFYLAGQRVRVSDSRHDRFRRDLKSETSFDVFSDNYGIKNDHFDW
jgi:hypothetical protein